MKGSAILFWFGVYGAVWAGRRAVSPSRSAMSFGLACAIGLAAIFTVATVSSGPAATAAFTYPVSSMSGWVMPLFSCLLPLLAAPDAAQREARSTSLMKIVSGGVVLVLVVGALFVAKNSFPLGMATLVLAGAHFAAAATLVRWFEGSDHVAWQAASAAAVTLQFAFLLFA